MVKLKEIEVTNPELDALEDLIFAWILCRKHLVRSVGKKDVETYKMQKSCKSCQNKLKKTKKLSFRLWKKLVSSYDAIKHK